VVQQLHLSIVIRITGDDSITAFWFLRRTIRPYWFWTLTLASFLDRKVLIQKLSLRFVPFFAADVLKVATESRFKSVLPLMIFHNLLNLSLTPVNTAWRSWGSWLGDKASFHIRVSRYISTNDVKLIDRFVKFSRYFWVVLAIILDRRLSIIGDESLLRRIIFRLKNRSEILLILVFVFFLHDEPYLIQDLVTGWAKLDNSQDNK